MRPVRLRPHSIFLPRPGDKHQPYHQIAGWHLRPSAEYIVGVRPAPKEEPITEQELADWRQRHGATCSDKIAVVLCGLERAFGRLSRDSSA